MSDVTFLQVPENNNVPNVVTEFDPLALAPGGSAKAVLVIGFDDPDSPGVQDAPRTVLGNSPWSDKAQISSMIRAIRDADTRIPITAIALDEISGGVAASGTLTITGTATRAGSMVVRVGGQAYTIGVAVDDTDDDVAAAIAAAVNAGQYTYVTAAAAANVVTFTASFTGEAGNQIPLSVNAKDSEPGVLGVAAAVTSLTSGAGVPDLAAAFALVAQDTFDGISTPFIDTTSVAAQAAEIARRWEALNEQMGQVFIGVTGTAAEVIAFGATSNEAGMTAVDSGYSASPPWEVAAEAMVRDLQKTQVNAGHNGITLPGRDAPISALQRTYPEHEAILEAGVSTTKVVGSQLALQRLITMKTLDANGVASKAEQSLPQRRCTEFLRRNWRTRVSAKYPNYLIATNAFVPANGVKVVTPNTVKAEAIAWHRVMEALALVQDEAAFIERLATSIRSTDGTRMDVYLPPFQIKELNTIATVIAPR